MKIVHFSDIHFGTEVPEIVDGLSRRLGELEPDLIVASGDFTMAARHRECEAARRFLRSLPWPVLATPGNHDMPVYNLLERFTRPFARYRAYIEPETVDRVACEDAALISVNSARPWDLSFDWSHGRLSNRQIDVVDRFFADQPLARFKALVVHHPFYVPEDLPGFRVIRNGEAMLDVLARHRVDAVLTGHLHRQFLTSRSLAIGDETHRVMLLQVATVASDRHRNQPNAFAVIDIEDDGVLVAEEVWAGSRFERSSRPPSDIDAPDEAISVESI